MHRSENKAVYQEFLQELERQVDMAELGLNKLIAEGDFKAIKFFLLTKGKTRGYTYKQEIEHQGEVETVFNIKLEDLQEEDDDNEE
ncbi:hypothetical protein D6783_06185 [Candidatus Woesearchaeota archaeon]|nr:MAG: hypothetical protein D6783_06185 [Candidatus Woesearchaeota archaeon]